MQDRQNSFPDSATLQRQLAYSQSEARKLRNEAERLKRHANSLMDELKDVRRSFKTLQEEHAAVIDATNPDSRTKLLAGISKLINSTEE